MNSEIPVITIDGPSGVGKGSVCLLLGKELAWNVLDSGAIYRALALDVSRQGLKLDDEHAIAQAALALPLSFHFDNQGVRIITKLGKEDVSALLRDEDCAKIASRIAALPLVRTALVDCQRRFRQPPGLVTDGRDMGTVIFPDARLKLFLRASPEIRAERRYKQLREAGISVSLDGLLAEIEQRDERDRSRDAAPLQPAKDAVIIDTSELTLEQVFSEVLEVVNTTL